MGRAEQNLYNARRPEASLVVIQISAPAIDRRSVSDDCQSRSEAQLAQISEIACGLAYHILDRINILRIIDLPIYFII